MKGVLAGYAIGSAAGLAVAILIDRSQFLQRGLLPIGNFVSALPIVGIAPIMVMWFGFDWPSKAAVVVVMTFFPMLVNTVAGLASAGAMERDLMKTYAADYWQTLLSLRLPAALPFIFNALKINTTLAMIGAIVAEFFGTPIVGMGFRISTEVGHLSIDMVWATIVVAALAGSAVLCARCRRRAARHVLARLLSARRRLDLYAHRVFFARAAREAAVQPEGRKMRKSLFVFAGVAALLAASAAQAADNKVTLQLKWVPQAQFAGYYVAKDKGFYKDEGLDVTIKPGGPGHRARAGDRGRRRRRDRRLDARRARRARKGRAAGQHRPALQAFGARAHLPGRHRHQEARGPQGPDARRLVLRQRISVPKLDGQAALQDRRLG